MGSVKTAISLDEGLFQEVNRLAGELHVSRSRLFVLAVQEYLKKQENRALLARLNEVYGDDPVGQDGGTQARRESHADVIGADPW